MRTSVLGGDVVSRGFFGPLSRPAIAAVGVVVVLTVVLWLGLGGVLGTTGGFVLLGGGVAAVYPWGGRRAAAERGLRQVRYVRCRIRGLHRFDPAARVPVGKRPTWPVPPPLGSVWPLDLRDTPHRDMFVLHHHNPGEQAYLSVLIQVDGHAGAPLSEQDASARYGTLLSQLAQGGSFITGLQQICRIGPHDPAGHRAFVAARLSTRNSSRRFASWYDGLVGDVTRGAPQHRNYVAVRFPVTGEFRAAARRYGPGDAGWAGLVRAELADFVRRAGPAGLTRPRVLGEHRACAVLRSLQDSGFPLDQHEGVRWPGCWQPYVAGRRCLVVNGKWFSRTAVVPRDAVTPIPRGPRWPAELLAEPGPPLIRTLSVRMELVPAAVARARALRDARTDNATRHTRTTSRGEDSVDETVLSGSQRRVRDLAPGSGHHGVEWAMAISVTARDPGELSRACARITDVAANCGLTRLDWQDTWHDAAAIMTLPLARGMAVDR